MWVAGIFTETPANEYTQTERILKLNIRGQLEALFNQIRWEKQDYECAFT